MDVQQWRALAAAVVSDAVLHSQRMPLLHIHTVSTPACNTQCRYFLSVWAQRQQWRGFLDITTLLCVTGNHCLVARCTSAEAEADARPT
jgi:hypothetical protein